MRDLENSECKGLKEWLRYGARGISSNAIVEVMEGYTPGTLTGMNYCWGTHPRDPADFNRCYKLLLAVPEYRRRLNELMSISPEWKLLVMHWEELEKLLLSELSTGEAPMLYSRMKELIRSAES